MVKIMNKLRQPLPINVDGDSIHFLAREKKEVTTEQFNSKEIQKHVDKDNLIVLEINEN